MKTTAIGIDLGTSNSAVSSCPLDADMPSAILIPQQVGLDLLETRRELPSMLYMPTPAEAETARAGRTWEQPGEYLVGQYARDRAPEAPDRVVASAKSWLCFHQVDPKAAVLPWDAGMGSHRVSPFDATRIYIEHIHRTLSACPLLESSLAPAEIVLTVPASFDEVARSLTVEAAKMAGLGEITLLEEPPAAFYNWLASSGDDWRTRLHVGDLVLVCDVGGGTSDFTLILVEDEAGELKLTRLSVGDHILLGGDNMDLALALRLRQRIESGKQKLDQWQFSSLMHSCRHAKERFCADSSLEELPIAVSGKRGGLFASALSTRMLRADIDEVLLEGFLPPDPVHCLPKEEKRSGLIEQGLPYATDAAISHHLAAFLVKSAQVAGNAAGGGRMLFDGESGLSFLMPNLVLFNGGVFNAPALRNRITEILESWGQGRAVGHLPSSDYAHAVSHGAAFFGKMKATGKGVRVRAGLSRSYYIGLERAALSAPGYTPPLRAVCVASRGMEEGESAELSGRQFTLLTGADVHFKFFSSEHGEEEPTGTLVDDAESDLVPAMELQGRISLDVADTRAQVPVQLRSTLSEIGLLEIWMEEVGGPGAWKLGVNTRVEQ